MLKFSNTPSTIVQCPLSLCTHLCPRTETPGLGPLSWLTLPSIFKGLKATLTFALRLVLNDKTKKDVLENYMTES